ncbi:MAG: TfoX/Sxy family DNA transformation protein [Roseibacillus sp.]
MRRPVTELRNLGPRCAEWLAVIGIHDEDGLRQVGAAAAYRELIVQEVTRPHRRLPYALAGALENEDCLRFSASRKRELQGEVGL